MQTEVHSPARTMRLLPIRLTSAITALSSHVFIEVRSKNFVFGNAARISSNIGPENVFSATVVGITETLKMLAAFEISAALLRRTTASIDLGRERHLRLKIDQNQGVIAWIEERSTRRGFCSGHGAFSVVAAI